MVSAIRVSLVGVMVVASAMIATALAKPSWAQAGKLTIASYGGAYTRSQVIAFIDPFRAETGIWVEIIDYDGGIEELADQALSLNVRWDVVDMTAVDARRACDNGLLEPLQTLSLEPAADGTPAEQDFIEGSLQACAVGQNVWSTIIGYSGDAYSPENAPTTLADFFDIERYPGSRGLQKTPRVNLEWALMSTGVAPEDVYATLETDAGLEQAFGALDAIRDQIVWWSYGEEPVRLLRDRRVAMSSIWNGRAFFHERLDPGSIGMIWDGNVWEQEYWAIPKGSMNAETAKSFIRFATVPERQAAQANVIAYGPTRKSAMAMVESDVLADLPTAPEKRAVGLAVDADWWAENQVRIQAAFDDWLGADSKRSFNPGH